MLGIGLIANTTDFASAQDKLDRTVLPIQAPSLPPITEVDARIEKATPVSIEHKEGNNEFNRKIEKVTIDLK